MVFTEKRGSDKIFTVIYFVITPVIVERLKDPRAVHKIANLTC